MTSELGKFVQMVEAVKSLFGSLSATGVREAIGQLNDLRDFAQRFKSAVQENDASAMRQIYAQYGVQMTDFQARLFGLCSAKTDSEIGARLERGWDIEFGALDRIAGHGTKLKGAVKEQLTAELDAIIGQLDGLSKSLSNRLKK